MARPTKLTPALLTKLDGIADAGMSLKAVCAKLDIDPDTFRTWETLPPDDGTVSRFLDLAARVRARANTGMLDKCDGIIVSALDDPDVSVSKKAELAIQYKRLVGTQRVELTGKDGGPVAVDVTDAKARLLSGLGRLTRKSDDE